MAAQMHLTGATSIATFAEDFYNGQPAVTVKVFGEGRAYFIGTRLDREARSALYGQIIAGAELQPVIDAALPPGVTAQLRGAGQEAFIILLNFSTVTQTVPLGSRRLKNVETDGIATGQLVLEPLGASVFRLE